MWPAPDHTRLVFDLSGPVRHKLFSLENPHRVVIDLDGVKLASPLPDNYDGKLVKDIRFAVRDKADLRFVLDLQKSVRPKSFVLKPNKQYGHRLVIDLEEAGADKGPVRSLDQLARARAIMVAVDAGHGGEDPGALGPTGVREKDVVLEIARRLARMIENEPGMRAFMVREGDYYLSLEKRVEKARRQGADLFLSIHADAFPDRRAKGASVYILSHRGATSEHARLLAKKENSADLVGGVSLEDKDSLLASVLLDLSQTATNEASYDIAEQILKRLGGVARIHKSRVERAGFRVLKAPDIPSLLVETAFISNPNEERALRSARYQERLADAIMDGVRSYFHQNPPPGTLLASRRTHTISRGDTLSDIARRYQVSTDALRSVNGLQGNLIRVGQVLQIPGGS